MGGPAKIIDYICEQCGFSFRAQKRYDREVKFCSHNCYADSKLGKTTWNKGKKWNQESKEKMSIANKGKRLSPKTEFTREKMLGSKNPKWIADRSKVEYHDKHTDPAYREWKRQVCLRDGWKCQTPDETCSKIIHAHHILRWAVWKELRYEVNNGILLCKVHHPLSRAEENRLAPLFQEIVNKKNLILP